MTAVRRTTSAAAALALTIALLLPAPAQAASPQFSIPVAGTVYSFLLANIGFLCGLYGVLMRSRITKY